MWLFWNNDFYEQTSISISPNNRSFRYGDGVFESMLWQNDAIPLWKAHWKRLQHSIKVLGLELQDSEKVVLLAISKLIHLNQLETARVRLMVYRSGAGTYRPTTSQATLLIETHPYTQSVHHPSSIVIYREMPKPCHPLSNLKTNNCLISILAARYAHQQGADDAIILNDKGTIAEATSSNVFIFQAGKLYTPPLSDAPLAGVMRAEWIHIAKEQGNWGAERSITVEELQAADEIWLTNAIRGGRRATLSECANE